MFCLDAFKRGSTLQCSEKYEIANEKARLSFNKSFSKNVNPVLRKSMFRYNVLNLIYRKAEGFMLYTGLHLYFPSNSSLHFFGEAIVFNQTAWNFRLARKRLHKFSLFDGLDPSIWIKVSPAAAVVQPIICFVGFSGLNSFLGTTLSYV